MSGITYATARPSIKDGDILLFRGRRALSYVIRDFSKSEYSHTGIAAWWGDRLMVMAADESGVRAMPLSRYVEEYDGGADWWTTDDDLDRSKAASAAKDELGKAYSIWGLIRVLRRILFKFKGTGDPTKPPEKFFCSQYITYCWRQGGIDLAEGIAADFAEPQDIASSKKIRKVGTLKK